MHQCRVYLPIDTGALRDWAAGQEVRVGAAYAVTEWLERAHPAEDEEGLEYLALLAARAAAVAARTGSRHPFVVAAADVDSDDVDTTPAVGAHEAQVRVTATVPRRRVVALHVEEPPAGGSAEPDLLWYDVTELDEVARLAGA